MSTTYSLAISTVADILNRTDVNTQIGAAINTALRKLEHKSSSNFNYMVSRNSVAVVLADGEYTITTPVRFKSFKDFRVFDGTDFVGTCKQVDESIAYASYPDVTDDTGTPSLISLRPDSSTLLIRPTADTAYNIWYSYYAYSAPLVVTTNETHWLLTNYEEVLIYGALVEMVALIKDFEREPLWRGRFNEVLRDLRNEEKSMAGALSINSMTGAYGTR